MLEEKVIEIERKIDSMIALLIACYSKIDKIESMIIVEDKTQNAREVMNNLIADLLIQLKGTK